MTEQFFTVDHVSLAPPQKALLATWLNNGIAADMRAVVRGKIQEQLAIYCNANFQRAEFPKYAEDMDKAQAEITRLRNFLSVFDELRKQSEFNIIKIKT